MALRTPVYLDVETLLSQAEYWDIDVAQQAEVVETIVRKRTGGGRVGISSLGIDASVGRDIARQSTYTLAPRQTATVSKVIDALIAEESVLLNPDGDSPLARDSLVEVEGTMRITAASLAGKMLYIVGRAMAGASDLDSMLELDADDPEILEQLKRVYLQNELLPIPVLLELTGSDLPQRVYVNLQPDHFVDAASPNRVEGELRVLGTVSKLVPGGNDGFLSAEDWLLDGWEYMMRRLAMLKIDELIPDLFKQLELDRPEGDVYGYITGPAIVINAIALY